MGGRCGLGRVSVWVDLLIYPQAADYNEREYCQKAIRFHGIVLKKEIIGNP